MTCTIDHARPADAPAISQLIIRTLRVSNARDYTPQVIAQVEQHFAPASILDLMQQRQVYVARADQQLIGTASLDGSVVRSVFVDPDWQGRGVGQALMAQVIAVARAARLSDVQVPSSVTAQAFYADLGFHKVRDQYHGEERTIVMNLSLNGPSPAH